MFQPQKAQLTFLGTGTSQGVPVIGCRCKVCQSSDSRDNRLRTSVLIKVNGLNFVIDTGPDFRQQMLRYNPNEDVRAVIFTHEHKDHIAGFDDIRAYNFAYKKFMDVYGTTRVWKAIRREFSYIFDEPKYPGVPLINEYIINNEKFEIDSMSFIPIEVDHYLMPVLGFRIFDLVYITDAKNISDQEKKKIMGCKVLIINALRHQEHISHFNLEQALEFSKEIGAPMTYLTHISHQLGLHEETEKSLPDWVRLAYDGLTIEV